MFRLAINIGEPYDNILIKVTQHNNRKRKAQQNNILKEQILDKTIPKCG